MTPAPPPTLRKRLWKAGGGAAIFLLTLALAGAAMDPHPPTGKLWLGHDFLPAYVAGHFARTGEPMKMYDRAAFREIQDRIVDEAGLDMDRRYAAALNPPHFALLFAPLSALPYRTAAAAWLAMNAAFFIASLVLMVRMLPPPARADWKTWALVPLLTAISMPFLQAAGHLQNTFLSLLILATVVTLWRKRQALAAGAAMGLVFYKPQLALVVSVMLVADLGRRAVLGIGLTGTGLLLVTALLMPGAITEYVYTLPVNVDWIQNQNPYNWSRQVTMLGFARLLFQGQSIGDPSPLARTLWLTGTAFGLVALAITFVRTHRSLKLNPASGAPRDRLIAATIAITPLLLPYYLDYDLLLLSIPAALFAADVIASPKQTRVDRWTTRAWLALFLGTYANPGLSGMMRVSLTVPLLAALAAGLIARALNTGRAALAPPDAEPNPTPARQPDAVRALAA